MTELVDDIAFPVVYGVNQRGMQAREVLTDWRHDIADWAWERGAMAAIQTSLELASSPTIVASVLHNHGVESLRGLPGSRVDRSTWVGKAKSVIRDSFTRVQTGQSGDPTFARSRADAENGILDIHKQVANRPLEPYMWHTAVHTAHVDGRGSSWSNLLALRATPANGDPGMAQPEFVDLADAARDAIEESEPTELQHGEWHTPYLRDGDVDHPLAHALSVARVARVSYVNQNGIRNLDDDFRLFLRLATADPAHAAPFEHVTRPMEDGHPGRIPNWESLRHLPGLNGLIGLVVEERERIAAAAQQAEAA